MNLLSKSVLYKPIVDALDRAMQRSAYVVTGCAPTAAGIGLQVNVAAGTIYNNGAARAFAGGNIVLDPADANSPRVDFVYLDATPALQKVTGVPLASQPVPGALPTNAVLLCMILVKAGTAVLGSTDIDDATMVVGLPDGTEANPPLQFGADPDTGIARLGTNVWVLVAGGHRVVQLQGDPTHVNYITATSAATGIAPTFSVLGSDTNIPFDIVAKGTGSVRIDTNSAIGLEVAAVASPVNYFFMTQAATTAAVQLAGAGTDSNISMSISSKGVGHVLIRGNNHSVELGQFLNVASAVNFLAFRAAATGVPPQITAEGTDTNVGLLLSSKGTSGILFYSGSQARQLMTMLNVASSVNYIQLSPAATGGGPRLDAVGSDTNIDFIVSPKGTGVFHFSYAAVALGAGGAATLGNTGGSGPSATAQNEWLKVKVNGNTRFIPLWA